MPKKTKKQKSRWGGARTGSGRKPLGRRRKEMLLVPVSEFEKEYVMRKAWSLERMPQAEFVRTRAVPHGFLQELEYLRKVQGNEPFRKGAHQ